LSSIVRTQGANRAGGILQDPDFNAVGDDTGHTVGYYNRVLNDGTDLNVVNGEGPERTRR
jgi:hypothetical protein